MSKLNNLPDWGQLILALVISLVAGTFAFAAVKSDVSLLQQKDAFIEQSINEIKQMLREEIDRHHPREK